MSFLRGGPCWTALLLAFALSAMPARAMTRQVPSDYPTIQSAVNAAVDGDVVLIAPGTYLERPTLVGKTITIASQFHTTADRSYIGTTIIDGGGQLWTIRVEPSAKVPTIKGLTIRHSSDGISANGHFNLLDCRVTNTTDGIDYETGGGGLVRGCTFEGNSDDGIDLDNEVTATIEQNLIRNNGDDGIEIRMQSYTGQRLDVIIRDNTISGNAEDGIQLISYDQLTSRRIRIERNLILGNAMAGLGIMCCSNTVENFQGASALERVDLFQNTFSGNAYGATGGDSLVALNNIFANTPNVAMKNVDAGSIAAYNLFFGNGTDHTGSNVDLATTKFVNPQLQPDWTLASTSPAIDAGIASYTWHGLLVWNVGPSSYSGAAPDLGAREYGAQLSVSNRVARPRAELSRATPDPSRGAVRFRLEVASEARVRLEILDAMGRRVRTLLDETLAAGPREIAWDGGGATGHRLSPGVYHAVLACDGEVSSRRFVRLE